LPQQRKYFVMLRHEAAVTDKELLRASAQQKQKKIAAKSGTNFNFYTGSALQHLIGASKISLR